MAQSKEWAKRNHLYSSILNEERQTRLHLSRPKRRMLWQSIWELQLQLCGWVRKVMA